MMKNLFLMLVFICPISLFAQNGAEKISPEANLQFSENQKADVLILFKDAADISAAYQFKSKEAKAAYVFGALQRTAERSQQKARQLVQQYEVNANSLFIVNALSISKCPLKLALELALLPEVTRISADPWVYFDAPVAVKDLVAQRGTEPEWGIKMIKADEVWKLGHKGQGITVGGADTGYDWSHPALRSKYRGTKTDSTADHNYHWHDAIHEISPLHKDSLPLPQNNPCGLNAQAPCDDHNHGTHTMGTMVGSTGEDNQIGVAPEARWVACRNMERGWGKPSSYLECFQWFLAPTDLQGKNADPKKAPHVINNSWYCSQEEGCTDLAVNKLLHEAVVALKKSGVVVVVSNGNFGPSCQTTNIPPAYFEESFSIGATRSDDSIANFSSRGPISIDGSLHMKPNVSAPGQDVRSCVRNTAYASFSGTSMAGPHVAGMVALLLSARPELIGQVDAVENIIEQSAMPKFDLLNCDPYRGDQRPNPIYGWGRVDVMAALNVSNTERPINVSPIVVRVNPNPIRDFAFLEVDQAKGEVLLEIISTDGKIVMTSKVTLEGGTPYRADLSQLSNGWYAYRISTNNGVFTGKISVLH
jgi:serine protease AprX